MDYLAIANKPIFWLLAFVTVLVSAVQVLLYMRQCKRASIACDIPAEVSKKAFRTGMITAIGPACGVFIVMVGLIAAIGSPMAWLRLSIIGSAATELTGATYGATAAGVTLGGEGYTLEVMAVSWFVMALNGAGWLLVTAFFTPSLEGLRNKMSGGDLSWLGVMSAACCIGIFSYLNVTQFMAAGGAINTSLMVVVISAAASMMLISKLLVPKWPKLAEYSLGIAMVIGIAAGIICDSIIA